MKASDRIIVNTLAQYARTIINTLLSLYATRLVLDVLGVSDYGIYTLVAGIVSMLSFLTNAFVRTTQRFLSYSQGKSDPIEMRNVFNNCLVLHICIGLFIGIVLELLTPLVFDWFIEIPEERLSAAKLLYQTVIFVLFLTFLCSPFRALLVSHENIVFTSCVEVVDGILKVLSVIALQFVSYDRLVSYGIFLLLIQLFNLITFAVYDFFKYKECCFPSFLNVNKGLLKNILSFAGWNMYNTGCILFRNQGVAIIINRFLSTAVNAAYGISFQVSACLGFVSNSVKNAFAPQIMRASASGDDNRTFFLSLIESKICFFLLSGVSIPIMFEMNDILSLWLKEVPPYTALFCDMMLLSALSDTLTTGLCTINLASGRLKLFSLISYSMKLLTLPTFLLALYFHVNVIYLAASFVFFELLSSLVRLPIVQYENGYKSKVFVKECILKMFLPLTISFVSSYVFHLLFSFPFSFILVLLLSFILYSISFYYLALGEREKNIVHTIFTSKISRLKPNKTR